MVDNRRVQVVSSNFKEYTPALAADHLVSTLGILKMHANSQLQN